MNTIHIRHDKPSAYDTGYKQGRDDAIAHGIRRSHEGEEEMFEGYDAGFTAMSQWLCYNKQWHEANKEYGTQDPRTMKLYSKYRECVRALESMDELCGLNGPKVGM